MFTAAPLITIWHGRREIGSIDPVSLQRRQDGPAIILLGGRSWRVTNIDWPRRIAFVEPSEDRGKSRWGSAGTGLSYQLAQAIQRVLAGHTPGVTWSARAQTTLATARELHGWVEEGSTSVVGEDNRLVWWTFGGLKANLSLAEHLSAGSVNSVDDLSIPLAGGVTPAGATAAIAALRRVPITELRPGVSPDAVTGLKFNECLPLPLAMQTMADRLRDDAGVADTLAKPIRVGG